MYSVYVKGSFAWSCSVPAVKCLVRHAIRCASWVKGLPFVAGVLLIQSTHLLTPCDSTPVLDLAAYTTMFASAFLAATILPAQSELVLIGFLTAGAHSVVGMLIVASIGNVLGSCVNYVLGLYAQTFQDRNWFPASPEQLGRARGFYHKWGRWSLLLAWMPIIGDPLTVVAGVMREPWWSFLILVTISKVTRYVALTAITLNLV